MKKRFLAFLLATLMCLGAMTACASAEESIAASDVSGDMIGVYKWVEMEDIGIDAYLVIWEDGIGIIDMLGVVETVKYDDNTMQSSGEGALPQNYVYKDGTLTWTAIGDDAGQVSTFVKLTAEELAAYQARWIGK